MRSLRIEPIPGGIKRRDSSQAQGAFRGGFFLLCVEMNAAASPALVDCLAEGKEGARDLVMGLIVPTSRRSRGSGSYRPWKRGGVLVWG
jgi:hypothetical protein